MEYETTISTLLPPSETKYMLVTKQHFDRDLHLKINQSGTIYELHWKRYDKNIFYLDGSWCDNFLWKSMEVFLGNKDFIISKPLQWAYPFYNNLTIEDNLSVQVEKRRQIVSNILKKSNKLYQDIINVILEYTAN